MRNVRSKDETPVKLFRDHRMIMSKAARSDSVSIFSTGFGDGYREITESLQVSEIIFELPGTITLEQDCIFLGIFE